MHTHDFDCLMGQTAIDLDGAKGVSSQCFLLVFLAAETVVADTSYQRHPSHIATKIFHLHRTVLFPIESVLSSRIENLALDNERSASHQQGMETQDCKGTGTSNNHLVCPCRSLKVTRLSGCRRI